MTWKQKSLLEAEGNLTMDLDYLRSRVTSSRARAIENLDKLLAEFENNFQKKGGEIWWIDEAATFSTKISSLSVGVPINSKGGLLLEELNISKSDPSAASASAISIEQGEFIIAETGQIIVAGAAPEIAKIKYRVIVVAIERVLAQLKDAGEVLSLMSEYPAWQDGNSFSILDHASGADEKLIVAIVDNGRHAYFESPNLRQMMRCIGCGACTQVCPLTGNKAGQNTTEALPLKWITNAISGRHTHDAFKSTLCGRCTVSCPVGIPIHHLFIEIREKLGQDSFIDRQHWLVYRSAVQSRRLMNQATGLKQFMLNRALKGFAKKGTWNFAEESFNEQWKKRRS